jgi:hypothetical protein
MKWKIPRNSGGGRNCGPPGEGFDCVSRPEKWKPSLGICLCSPSKVTMLPSGRRTLPPRQTNHSGKPCELMPMTYSLA